MNHTIYAWILIFIALFCANVSAISIVYNLRIAQITKQPLSNDKRDTYETVMLLFDQYQKKYNGIRQNFIGGLGTFIYNFKSCYFRVDAAASHIHQEGGGATPFSGTETDDILFTGGYNFKMNDRALLTLSGLFGIPTHKILSLQHVSFGYGEVGAGAQIDGSYALNHTTALLYAARYIHFLPRTAQDNLGINYRFTIGNLGDLLVACKNSWTKHGLEGGYTARANFGAHIYPHLDDTVAKTNYQRSSFYLVYKYNFLIHNLSSRLLFNIAYGFDHKPKIFGNKHILTLWTAWKISF